MFEAGRDSVAVFDTARHTVTLFAPDGRVLSTLSGVAQARCCFSDGSALVTNFVPGEGQRVARSGAITSLPGATHPSSTSRPTLSFSVVSFREPTRARTTVLTVDGDDPEFMLPPRSTPQGVVYIGTQVRPFMRRAYIELAADEIVYGIPDSYEYKVFSRSGALLRTVRAAITPEPVTAAERDSLRNNFEDRRRGPDMTSAYTEGLEDAATAGNKACVWSAACGTERHDLDSQPVFCGWQRVVMGGVRSTGKVDRYVANARSTPRSVIWPWKRDPGEKHRQRQRNSLCPSHRARSTLTRYLRISYPTTY